MVQRWSISFAMSGTNCTSLAEISLARSGRRAERGNEEGQPGLSPWLTDSRVLHASKVPANPLSGRLELEVLQEDKEDRLCG